MDSSFIVVAKSVMENSQKLAALEYALQVGHPDLFTLYIEKLKEYQKSNELYFQKMNDALAKLNEAESQTE